MAGGSGRAEEEGRSTEESRSAATVLMDAFTALGWTAELKAVEEEAADSDADRLRLEEVRERSTQEIFVTAEAVVSRLGGIS